MNMDDHLCRSDLDLSTLCRICMSEGPCRPVLSDANPNLADAVYEFYRIRICENDVKTKMICDKCMQISLSLVDKQEMARKTQQDLKVKIKKAYGDQVEEINNKLRLKKNIEPLAKIEKSKLDKKKINEPKIEELRVDKPTMKKPTIEKQKTVGPKLGFISLKETNVKSEIGCLKCQYCNDTYFDSIDAYVKHSSEVHNYRMELKYKELKLCPLCDCNFDNSVYLKHLEDCTNCMLIGDGSKDNFMCNICSVFYKNVTGSQFRQHYMFCKSFRKIATDGSLSYKCFNCTFESSDLGLCTTHASSTCLYLRMNLKYT